MKNDCLWLNVRQGNRLVELLGLAKGPLMGRVLDAQVRWQLQYPAGTVQQCVENLRQAVAALPAIEKEHTDRGKSGKKRS